MMFQSPLFVSLAPRLLPVVLFMFASVPCSATLVVPDQPDVSGGGLGRVAVAREAILAEAGYPLDDRFEGTVTLRCTMKWDTLGGTGGTAAFSWASFQLFNQADGELAGFGNQWESAKISTFREPGDTGFSRDSGTVVAAGVAYPFTLTITYHAHGADTAVLNGGGFVNQALKSGDWSFDHIRVRAGNGSNQVDFTGMSLGAEGISLAFDRQTVPEPVFADAGYLDLYWTAWEQAYAHIKSQEGLPQSPYMDEALWDTHIWIWDTAFMTFFTKYSPEVFPGVQSLRNFYGPMHDGVPVPLIIQHPDNPPLFAWSEFANWRANAVVSRGHASPQAIADSIGDLERHYAWFHAAVSGQNWGGTSTVFSRTDDVDGKVKGFGWNGVASGMDNTPRGRSAGSSMLWVDAISQQALSALFIARLAEASGDMARAASWRAKHGELKETINRLYWSAEDGIYYDIHRSTNAFDKVRTPASYWPMLAGLCSEEQALALAQHARQPSSFGGIRPWVTVARNDADFRLDNGRYWRGGIWLPAAYMAIKGLETYGYQKLADETAAALVRHMRDTFRNYSPATIWECYNPRLDEPARTSSGNEIVRPDFCGWSALGPISLFIENVLGFHDIDAQTRTVRWRLHQPGVHGIRRLKFGEVVADMISDGEGRVTVDTNLPFTLEINGTSHAIAAPRTVLDGIALPDAPLVTQRVEAEDGVLAGGARRNTNQPNYSGTGFVDGFDSAETESVSLDINSVREGRFPVSICFSRGEAALGHGAISISVNGGAPQVVNLPNSTSWNRWMWTSPVELDFNAGSNTLIIANPDGVPGICNLDCLEIQFNNRPPAAPALDRTRIPTAIPAGAVVANLSLTDPDTGDHLRALLVAGHEHFRIEDNRLVSKAALPAGKYPLTLRCADWGGAFTDAAFVITVAAVTDADGDGMDDGWETSFFGSTSAQAALDDFDSDGTHNITEFRLGLDPANGSSRFAAMLTRDGEIQWPGKTGLLSIVERSTSLAEPSWSDIATIANQDGTNSFTDPSPPSGRAFYRIRLDD